MVEEYIYEEDRHRNLFGRAEVYNPWSVTTYVSEHVGAPERFAEPYWANTSSNSIIKELIENADEGMREELDTLISGGTIEKRIHEEGIRTAGKR